MQSKDHIENNLVLQLINQGLITKETLGIDEKMAEQIYSKAYQLYQAGKYEEAQSLFTALLLVNNQDPTFLFGLAACYLMLKDYDLAAKLYLQAGALDPKNPVPFYYAACCYWQKQEIPSAFALLNLVIGTAGHATEYKEIRGRAQLMLESINSANPAS